MCDPLSGILAAVGAATSLFGGGRDKSPPPPKPPVAAPTLASRAPGADVKVGDGAASDARSSTPQFDGFATKRVAGRALGGLGRGGLGL